MLVLLGVAVVIVGFALRLNALLVVITAALVTGLLAGLSMVEVLSAFGKAFNDNRFVSVAWLVLPVIGVLERAGLISRGRDAQRRPCQLRATALDEVTRWTQHTREAWSERFEQLDDYLKKLQAKPPKETRSHGRKKS